MRRAMLWRNVAVAVAGAAWLGVASGAAAQDGTGATAVGAGTAQTESDPISALLATLPPEVRRYDQHITTLANPFFEGRAPGTRGNAVAAEYIEFWLRQATLQPAFGQSFRQTFEPRAQHAIGEGELAWKGLMEGPTGKASSGELGLGNDFSVLARSGNGAARGQVVFVGYGIESGPDGYASFDEGTDLRGSVALVLRFEPMDEDGASLWAERGWSPASAMDAKLRAVAARKPSAIVLVNPPGVASARASQGANARADALLDAGGGLGNEQAELAGIPVVMLTTAEVDRMVTATTGLTLMDLRERADAGRTIVPLAAEMTVTARVQRSRMSTDNVAGVIPGVGELADEFVVVGAHYDHVGYGKFGTSVPDTLHPGADDNGSGTSAVLLLAERLAGSLAQRQGPRRSVMFVLFSAEESGLEGSRYFVERPPVPLASIRCMVNMDMVGRLREGRLDVQGLETAEGLDALVFPILQAWGMTVVREKPTGNSDHASFRAAGVPIVSLFTGYHDVYHTPKDTSDTINRVGAVRIVRAMGDVVSALAEHRGSLAFIDAAGARERRTAAAAGAGGAAGAGSAAGGTPKPDRFGGAEEPAGQTHAGGAGVSVGGTSVRVRFGIMPGNYDAVPPGVLIAEVFPSTSAENAGLKEGDLMVAWNGSELDSVESWMPHLSRANPGDVVEITYLRKGERRTTRATLIGRD